MDSPVWLDSHPDAVLEENPAPVFVHHTHDMGPKIGTDDEECFKCMLCTCHGSPELALKCGDIPKEVVSTKASSQLIDIRHWD